MSRKYRSARGKSVDLDRVLSDNENVRAAGNMNINARGDTIDSDNNIIQSRNDRVKNAYRKQHKSVVHDDAVPTSKRDAERLAQAAAKLEAEKPVTQRIAEEYQQEKQTVAKPEPKPAADIPQPKEVEEPEAVINPITESIGERAAPAPKQPATQEVTEVPQTQAQPAPVAPEPQAVTDVPVDTKDNVQMKAESVPKGKGGLAAAIAKARESKQELMKTERQQARESSGVKRI
jgi:hypothetical protein